MKYQRTFASSPGPRLWADDGGNRLQASGSSLVATNLRLAGLRYVSQLPGTERFSYFLGDDARWSAVFSYRRSFEADQARRIARHRRRHSIALTRTQRKHFPQGENACRVRQESTCRACRGCGGVTLTDGPLGYAKSRVSRQAGRPRRVCGPRMMVMKKYREAIPQERIVGNGNLKKLFLHITRQVWPKFKRCVA